jgi:hypothetical protein
MSDGRGISCASESIAGLWGCCVSHLEPLNGDGRVPGPFLSCCGFFYFCPVKILCMICFVRRLHKECYEFPWTKGVVCNGMGSGYELVGRSCSSPEVLESVCCLSSDDGAVYCVAEEFSGTGGMCFC